MNRIIKGVISILFLFFVFNTAFAAGKYDFDYAYFNSKNEETKEVAEIFWSAIGKIDTRSAEESAIKVSGVLECGTDDSSLTSDDIAYYCSIKLDENDEIVSMSANYSKIIVQELLKAMSMQGEIMPHFKTNFSAQALNMTYPGRYDEMLGYCSASVLLPKWVIR